MISQIANTVFLGLALKGWVGLLGFGLILVSVLMAALFNAGVWKDRTYVLHRCAAIGAIFFVIVHAIFTFSVYF